MIRGLIIFLIGMGAGYVIRGVLEGMVRALYDAHSPMDDWPI